jgi:hypothetical protein
MLMIRKSTLGFGKIIYTTEQAVSTTRTPRSWEARWTITT